jgi:undecaprenyl-diphosphatase
MLPCAVIGIPLDDFFEEKLYGPIVIAITLIVYGVAFILIERLKKGKAFRVEDAGSLTLKDAALIGCFQVLSLIPGTSRSGSTILGAMLLGVSRKAAAEYSFFMAIPVMLGASALKLAKHFLIDNDVFTTDQWILLAVATVVSFVVSLVVIRFLMAFIKKHSFAVFGWYRIVLGAAVLLVWWLAPQIFA